MKFTNIRDLKYVTPDNSIIDLLASCEEYGEIPMTLNLVDTEDLHTAVLADGSEMPLEAYCLTQTIAPFDIEKYEKDLLIAEQYKIIEECEKYFSAISWRYERFIRKGVAIPDEILTESDLCAEKKEAAIEKLKELGADYNNWQI